MTRVMRTAATGTTVPEGMSESDALKLLAIAKGRVEPGQTKARKTTPKTKEKKLTCSCATRKIAASSTFDATPPDTYGLRAAREKDGPTRQPWRHSQAARGTASAFERELDAFVEKQAKEARAAEAAREEWARTMGRFAPPDTYRLRESGAIR